MNALQVGRSRFSRIFWGILGEGVRVPDLQQLVEQQQRFRVGADYNTGSLSTKDAEDLYTLVRFFQPAVIAEVGTFIGVSTQTMALAAPQASIHTCDISNALQGVLDGLSNVKYYPKSSSSEMFRQLVAKNSSVDLLYLDGRLSEEDFDPLLKLVHDNTVFVFDDFEGIEKGVVNAMMLDGPGRILVYPREGRKTAVSLPSTLFQIVRQEFV